MTPDDIRTRWPNLPGIEPDETAEHLATLQRATPEAAAYVTGLFDRLDRAFKASAAFATHGEPVTDDDAQQILDDLDPEA